MKIKTCLARFSVCAWLTGYLLSGPVDRSLAQSTGISNATLPVVTIQATDPEASEPGTNTGMFLLNRAGSTNLALSVFLQIGGTAANGLDYAAIPTWILVPAGVRELQIPVRPIDDVLYEGVETVEARLVYPPTMPPINYLIGSPSNAVVSIYDNDPAPTNRPPWVNIVAPTNGAAFIAPVDIRIAAQAGDPDAGDYVATVEFFAGTNRLGIVTNNPSSASPVNPFQLVWSNVPPGSCVLTARATDNHGAATVSARLEIVVKSPTPPPFVTVQATDPHASEPGLLAVMDPGEFTITRGYGTNVPLTVNFSISGTASNGVDYLRLPASVVIPAGQLSTRVVVCPQPDTLLEPVETVVLRIESPICVAIYPPPYECYQVGTPGEAVVYIADNPPPTNLPPVVRLTKPLEGQTFAAPVNIPLRAVTVDPDGYVPHIEFYAGTNLIGAQTRYFLMPPPPGQEMVYEMVWTNPVPGRYLLTARSQDDRGAESVSVPVQIWVVRINEPPVTNLPTVVTITAPDPVASEGTNCVRWDGWNCCVSPANWCGTNMAVFVVRRSGPTNAALTVYYRVDGTASNGVDYAELPGMVTIPAGRWASEIKVVPVDDLLPEPLETVVLRLCVPPTTTASVPPYLVGYPGRAAAVIVDNDAQRPATSVLSDRCFHVMRPGTNGTSWRIDCSTNLVDWTPVCTTTVTDGAIHFVDPDADDLTQRYYRALPDTNAPTQ